MLRWFPDLNLTWGVLFMKKSALLLAASVLFGSTLAANADVFTTTSPSGALPAGVTQVGGLVLDLKGTNGVRIVSQLAASSLFVGYANTGTPGAYQGNPLTIGIQSGFTPAILTALGGTLADANIRMTLWDGDSAPGNFDANQNTLFLNGVSFGDFTAVATEQTDSSGTTNLGAGFGFGDGILSTGFFDLTNAGDLATLLASLAGGTATFTLSDVDPNDNFYDFTQGVDGGLINVGQGPGVVGVPEPVTMTLFGAGLVGVAALRRRRKAQKA
jgi:hypothetical protein